MAAAADQRQDPARIGILATADVHAEPDHLVRLQPLARPGRGRQIIAAFAAHHGGMLPSFRHAVEELFVKGLVRAVFATETLALGINMPARSVVLERLDKFNGEARVDITPGEYTQLTGRAGRRGIDVEALAVIAQQQRGGMIATAEPPTASNEIWEGFVRTFKFDPQTEQELIDGTGDYSKFGNLDAYAHAFSHTTIAETVLRAGGAINVLPSHAYLEMDVRPFPGQTQEDLDDFLRSALGDMADEVEIEHLITEDATQSSTDTELWRAIEATSKEFFPDKDVVPVHATGGSDLRFARRRGGNAYGFAMHAEGRDMASANSQLHSHDEHLYLEDLELTVRAYRSLVNRFLGLSQA